MDQVVEFLLGRYGASTDPAEIEEGLQIVEKQHLGRTVRTGEEELFKARARDQGSVKIIDRLVLVGLVIVRQSDGDSVSFRDLSKESGEAQQCLALVPQQCLLPVLQERLGLRIGSHHHEGGSFDAHRISRSLDAGLNRRLGALIHAGRGRPIDGLDRRLDHGLDRGHG